MGRIAIRAKPGSREDRLAWDRWRNRWIVSCRARPVHGEANDAIARLVAGWVGVSPAQARWVVGGRSADKVLEVDGMTDRELSDRLDMVRARSSGSARSDAE